MSGPAELPLPEAPELPPIVCCRECNTPVSSDRARRTGIGGGCRRKLREGIGRRGRRFTVAQDPLPEEE